MTFCNISVIMLLDFLSSIKHPTAEFWHPHVVLMLLLGSDKAVV